MKVAACQLPDVQNDVPRAVALVDVFAREAEARGACLVCFPECFVQGYSVDLQHASSLALDLASSGFTYLLDRLRHLEPLLIIGLIEREADRIYNSAVVIRRGALIGRYRKMHLLRGETAVFAPGDGYSVFDAAGMKFGINICYDLNFPEPANAIASAGAHLLVCPSNNMLPRDAAETWKPLHNRIRAERARQTGLWLLSADVVGERDGRISYGPTALIDPEGTIVEQVPLTTSGTLVADIPPPIRG